jgi:hypothetical protein
METITPTHWQKMAAESRLSWPRIRERIADLSQRTIACLHDDSVRSAANDSAIADHVAGIIERRAFSFLQNSKEPSRAISK